MPDKQRILASQRPRKNQRKRQAGRRYSRRDFVRVLFKRRRAILWTTTGLFLLGLAGLYVFGVQSKVIEQAQSQAIRENEEKMILALRLERAALIQKYPQHDRRVRDVDSQIRLAEEKTRSREGPEDDSQVGSMGTVGGARLMIVLALAISGGIGVAFVHEWLNHSFTTGEELERKLGITHLVSIPEQGVGKK